MTDQILKMKEEIKKLSQSQKDLKGQRKTVHFTGKRTMEPWEATIKVRNNKILLRHMYIVYGMLRGKDIDTIEPNRKTEPNQRLIDRLMMEYSVPDTA